MTATPEWPTIFREVGVGLGVLLIGIGVLFACVALAAVLKRLGSTLDEVDRQIAALGAPVARTLDHVNGIAGTADTTLARVGGIVGRLEDVAGAAAKGANFIGSAFSPALVNAGSTLTGVTAGIRRLLGRRNGRPEGGIVTIETTHGGEDRRP